MIRDPSQKFAPLLIEVLEFNPKPNLKTCVDRAESMQAGAEGALRHPERHLYSVGMGGSDLFDPKIEAKNRRVEVWAVFP